MAGHFLFIYVFFVRGAASSGADPDAWTALRDLLEDCDGFHGSPEGTPIDEMSVQPMAWELLGVQVCGGNR